MKKKKNFPNGFDSWLETFYEIVTTINERYETENPFAPLALEVSYKGGRGFRRLLAEAMTDEFENMNKGREWDGGFFDEVDDFVGIVLSEPLEGHRYNSYFYGTQNQ